MKKLIISCVLLCLFIQCESPFKAEEKRANVVMFEGPIFEDGYSIFYYKGRVKNIGNASAQYAKIYIYCRRADNSLLSQEWNYIEDTDLTPDETSPWQVLFSDSGRSIRDNMDKSKTTYEIKWD